MPDAFRVRVRSIRFKDGRAPIRVLKSDDKTYAHVMGWVRGCLDAQTHKNNPGSNDIAGFAFVVWAADGTSVCEAQNLSGHIPTVLIPDFVRNRLLAERIETWTLESLKR